MTRKIAKMVYRIADKYQNRLCEKIGYEKAVNTFWYKIARALIKISKKPAGIKSFMANGK